MKFNYSLSRLCGAAYGAQAMSGRKSRSGGSNVVFNSEGTVIYSPVSNRVQVIDLISHSMFTLPFQARSNVSQIALSPDDHMLVIVDVDDYALLTTVPSEQSGNRGGAVVLHRFHFKRKVRCIEFSPDGLYLAVSYGRHVRVWHTPAKRKEYAPFLLHDTLTGLSGDVEHISWSPDSSVLIGSSRDSTARIWTLHRDSQFFPVTLAAHKTPLVAAFFATDQYEKRPKGQPQLRLGDYDPLTSLYTISTDGVVITWSSSKISNADMAIHDGPADDDSSTTSSDDSSSEEDQDRERPSKRSRNDNNAASSLARTGQSQAKQLVGGKWSVAKRHFIQPKGQETAQVTCAAMEPRRSTLVLGFSSGLFGLYEMPECANIHTLSLSNASINTTAINRTGEWLAFGSPFQNQLLVWEWRSETYVIKQQGHNTAGMKRMAYSPDSAVVATGGQDGRIKLWDSSSGFCFVTFQNHTAPVTDLAFANATVVLSSSLDGTIRAHDLVRYRNFRTMTAPSRVQFSCMAVDGSGEIVCAGTLDSFEVYLWSLQTGKVLDVLSGHRGPVSSAQFHPRGGTLATASWDGSVRVWDVYKRDSVGESLDHQHEVVCAAFRPDGVQLCTSTLSGVLHFWKVEDASLMHVIEGQRDIAGGRKFNDRMTADNNASSRYFTSVCYTADGSCVLAGGNSKYVCIYEISQQILLKKFQISTNRSLDGVLDELNSKNMGDGGPIDPGEDSGDEDNWFTPGAKRLDEGSRKHRVEVLTSQVGFSPTGREWAAVSGEGLHLYSLDDDLMFDPVGLTEAITPSAVLSRLETKQYGAALAMSMHLNEVDLLHKVLEAVPYASIVHVVKTGVGQKHLDRLMQAIVTCVAKSPHVEFFLQWCLAILETHGLYLQRHRSKFMRVFRGLHRAVKGRYNELKAISDENRYTLEFLEEQARLMESERSRTNAVVLE